MLTTDATADILQLAPRTVRKYCQNGWLESELIGGRLAIDEDSALWLKTAMDAYSRLGERVKWAYIHKATGVPLESVAHELGKSVDMVTHGISFYELRRSEILLGYGADGSYVLTEEVMQRLSLSDMHVVHSLIAENDLDSMVSFDGSRKKYAILACSLISFLGDRRTEIMYRSDYAAEEIGCTINEIDRIALGNRIGMKVREGHKNSSYLFTAKEVGLMKQIYLPN
ncbi:MAG: hypothetical protein NDI94_07135 [Candidatus Woesearchaeota archaeon]|nr:hypothetical protein [Candidatus Woesearchaeota archaeon]